MVSGKLTPSQSHGGVLYYLVEVPKEEYEKSKHEQAHSYSTHESNQESSHAVPKQRLVEHFQEFLMIKSLITHNPDGLL